MLKWLVILGLLAAATYYTVTQWPVVLSSWSQFSPSILSVESWSDRDVAGLHLNFPVTMQLFTPSDAKTPPANVTVDYFRGRAGRHVYYITHASNSVFVGTPMLGWADRALAPAAAKLKLRIISKNTATGMIHDLRARRSDYVSADDTTHIRLRCVLLERGSDAWFVECHTPEDDSEAENIFLKIANSAR